MPQKEWTAPGSKCLRRTTNTENLRASSLATEPRRVFFFLLFQLLTFVSGPLYLAFSFDISSFPTTSALLSVGTYVASSNTPAQGYHIVFDTKGAGVIYTALDSAAPLATSLDRVLTLSSPTPVDMGGITLTSSAISLTMANVGYILDKVRNTLSIAGRRATSMSHTVLKLPFQ